MKAGEYEKCSSNNMILYLEGPKNSTQNLLDTINSYSKVAGYKINIENH
jgi:hypothetical protein